jgi:hypothetical protein
VETPNQQTNYVTCSCQHCSGHIKFNANELRKGETRIIECPHCHLETVLFDPNKNLDSQKEKTQQIKLPQKQNIQQIKKSTGFELFLFQLTRFCTIAGAALAVIAFAITIILLLQTFQPEKPQKIFTVSYEDVAPAINSAASSSDTHFSSENDIDTSASIPKNVAWFLANHQNFNFKEMLSGVDLKNRKAFLENLDEIIQKAKSHSLADEQLLGVVNSYADWWKSMNIKKEDPLAKQITRNYYIMAASGLFGAITILCLILVLLAVERNTRMIAQKLSDSANAQKSERN